MDSAGDIAPSIKAFVGGARWLLAAGGLNTT